MRNNIKSIKDRIFAVPIEDFAVMVKVGTYIPYNPGVYDKAPEDCYPAEEEVLEWEILNQTLLTKYLIEEGFSDVINDFLFEKIDEINETQN